MYILKKLLNVTSSIKEREDMLKNIEFIDVSEDEGVFVYVPDEEVYDANDKSQKR